jgi:hypothetical protein
VSQSWINCDVCSKYIEDEDVIYELFKKRAAEYSDCMRQTIVCSQFCLKALAAEPDKYLEFQEG